MWHVFPTSRSGAAAAAAAAADPPVLPAVHACARSALQAPLLRNHHNFTSMEQSQAQLAAHQHGKSRVRLGRVWRIGDGEQPGAVPPSVSARSCLQSAVVTPKLPRHSSAADIEAHHYARSHIPPALSHGPF